MKESTTAPAAEVVFNQSMKGTGLEWTTLHLHQRRYSRGSTLNVTVKAKICCIMYDIVYACVQETNPSYFFSQVKNKPNEPMGAMCLFLRRMQSRTITLFSLLGTSGKLYFNELSNELKQMLRVKCSW